MELTLCVVVIAFAVIQSVFGVGLLVFGTPALLLLGLPFDDVLAYLLPCSIVISLLQVIGGDGGFRLDPLRTKFLVFTAPLVLLGTALILTVGVGLDVRLIVGAVLVFSGAIRVLGPARRALSRLVRRHLSGCFVILGAVHGVSNLGGGVLTLIVGSVYDAKEEIRRQIAFCYGVMASVQLVTLWVASTADAVPWLLPLLPTLAAAAYLAIGNRAFLVANQAAYQHALTALILFFGLALVLNG
jgi:hypothetical protein